MQNSSEFQYIAIDTIHESATNPRKTFDEGKLTELAESIRTNGLIQPITVRPDSNGFEIVAGARRFRAAQLAEQFSLPARIVDIDGARALEWRLVENSQRVDVHPYEEAQGFQRLLDMPGYDVATLVEKSGKSATHVYARLSLLQLVPAVAGAFSKELITASHANLLARLPQHVQQTAYEQCWRKDWQDKEPHLLPAKHLSAWIQNNLYLSLADAPFSKEDTTLNPAAGACITCPRRSGFNTSLSPTCRATSVWTHPASTSRSMPTSTAKLPPIQDSSRLRTATGHQGTATRSRAQRHLPRNRGRPRQPGCRAGSSLQSCQTCHHRLRQARGNDPHGLHGRPLPCPRPPAAARKAEEVAENPTPVMTPAAEEEVGEEAAQREAEYEQRRKEHHAEEERRAEERKREFARQEEELEAELQRKEEVRKQRQATYERILADAPEAFTAAQLRMVLRAIVHLDPYTFADDLVEAEDENESRSTEEILLSTIDNTEDGKLTRFALRLALSGHLAIPRKDEPDFTCRSRHGLPTCQAAQGQEAEGTHTHPHIGEEDRAEEEAGGITTDGSREAPALSSPMDRTESTLRRLHEALDSDGYNIGVLDSRGMYPKLEAPDLPRYTRIPPVRLHRAHFSKCHVVGSVITTRQARQRPFLPLHFSLLFQDRLQSPGEWMVTAHPPGKHVPQKADKPEETEPNTMFNKIILIGRLGQNAEAKTTQNNRDFTVLSVATQESWKNDKGEYETRTEWHRVYAWGKLSKFAAAKLEKGQFITLEGTLRYREVTEDIENIPFKHRIAEVHASSIKRLSKAVTHDDPQDGAEDE